MGKANTKAGHGDSSTVLAWLGFGMTPKSTLRKAALLLLLAACAKTTPAPAPAIELNDALMPPRLRTLLGVIAADSMEGRRAGSRGYLRAATFVAAEMRRLGLTAAGDSGFFQRVPVMRNAQGRMILLTRFTDWDSIPAAQRVTDVNLVGMVPGADPELQNETVIVGAHLDALGIRPAVAGDSIVNGADDDASGVVAVLEAARLMLAGPRPKRTVLFIAFTREEYGSPSGSRWYVEHPVRPLAGTVAELQIEMIGRPDSLAGGAGKAWLTGYERSTMGEMLAAAGLAIVADPRPAQQFFRRSDNYRFALLGIPSHTLSSFGGHADYHQPGDEASKIDLDHMQTVVTSVAKAVRILADGPRPEWKPGGRPEPASPVAPPKP